MIWNEEYWALSQSYQLWALAIAVFEAAKLGGCSVFSPNMSVLEVPSLLEM